MHDDVGAAGAEPSSRGETGRHRSGQDVDVRDLHKEESNRLLDERGCEQILTGTSKYSVTPRPVLPIEPKDQLSSRIRRYLYLCLSSSCTKCRRERGVALMTWSMTLVGNGNHAPLSAS